MASSIYTSAVSFWSQNGNAKYRGWLEVTVTNTSSTTYTATIKQCAGMINGYGTNFPVTVKSYYVTSESSTAPSSTSGATLALTSSGSLNYHPGSSWAWFAYKSWTSGSLTRTANDTYCYFYVVANCPNSRGSTSTSSGWLQVKIPKSGSRTVYYSANYDDAAGINSSASTPIGTSITIANYPSRTGYTCIGWNTNSKGGGTSYSAGAAYTGADNLLLYAQWNQNTTIPKLNVTTLARCDSSGNETMEGTNIKIVATVESWGDAQAQAAATGGHVYIKIRDADAESTIGYTQIADITSPNIDFKTTNNAYSTAKDYDVLITITNDCDFSWNFEYVGEIVSDGYIMKIATNGIINYGADLYTNTVSDIITPASGWTISGAYYYQYGRTAMLLITCYRSSATAAATEVNIGTLKEGKRPIFPACGNLTTGVAMLANVYAAIDGKIYMRFGAQLAASTSVTFGVTYLI